MTTQPIGPGLSPRDRADILIAEYNALYGLAVFRMGALDRRVPAAGAALLAFMGSVPVLPDAAQAVFLIAIPASLVWLLRTTINHARSFEDLLRRIEHVEGALNRLAGDDLVGFQSSHPSRLKAVGGRTGAETVVAVLMAAFILIGACAVIGRETFPGRELGIGYVAFLGAITAYLSWIIWRWTRYRYAARTAEGG